MNIHRAKRKVTNELANQSDRSHADDMCGQATTVLQASDNPRAQVAIAEIYMKVKNLSVRFRSGKDNIMFSWHYNRQICYFLVLVRAMCKL